MGYIDKFGNYYEGDKADPMDKECPNQPSPYHSYNSEQKKWVMDPKKVQELKRHKAAEINGGYESYVTLNKLSDDERAKIDSIYNNALERLMGTMDPFTIEKIVLNF